MYNNKFNDSSNLQANAYDNAILRYQKQKIQESEQHFKNKCDQLNQKINLQKNYLERLDESKQLNEWVGLINVLPRAAELAGRIGTWANDPKVRAVLAGIAFEELLWRTMEKGGEIQGVPGHGGGFQPAPPGTGPSLPGAPVLPGPKEYIEIADEEISDEDVEGDTDVEGETEEDLEEQFTGKRVNLFLEDIKNGSSNFGTPDYAGTSQETPQTVWGAGFIFRHFWDDMLKAIGMGGKYADDLVRWLEKEGYPGYYNLSGAPNFVIRNGKKFRLLSPPPLPPHPRINYANPGDIYKRFAPGFGRSIYDPFIRQPFGQKTYYIAEPRHTPDGKRFIERFFKPVTDVGQGMYKDRKGKIWFLSEPKHPKYPNGIPFIYDKKRNKWIIKKSGNPFNI